MIIAGITSVVIALAVAYLSFSLEFQRLKAEGMTRLEAETISRAAEHQVIFDQLRSHQKVSIEGMWARFHSIDPEAVDPKLDRLIPEFGDGTRRSIDGLFEGMANGEGQRTYGIAAFIPRADGLTEKDKTLFIAAFETVRTFGPSLSGQFDNFWFLSSRGDVIVYAPNRPNKLLSYRRDLPSDWDVRGTPLSQAITRDYNPDRQLVCTGLTSFVFDKLGRSVTTGCETPVDDDDGVPLGAFGVTLPLEGWLERIVSVEDGTNQDIVIASPQYGLLTHTDLERESTSNDVTAIGDRIQIDHLLQFTEGPSGSFEDKELGSIVAYAAFEGPGWYILTIQPNSVIAASAFATAFRAALSVLLSAVLLQALIGTLVYRRFAKPLIELTTTAESETEDAGVTLRRLSYRDDELGALATALVSRDKRL